MAKKKSPTTSAAAAAAAAVTAEEDEPAVAAASEEEEEMELLQVELGDMVKMKQVLDEAVIAAVTEIVPEDTRWDNFKLILMTASCIAAMIAQFAPLPFPESRPVLGICGSLYFILSGILQLITTYVDRDAILWTRPLAEAIATASTDNKKKTTTTTTTTTQQQQQACGICVRSNFPRFSEFYTVTLELVPPKDDKDKASSSSSASTPPKTPPSVSQTWSVGNFFDKEGYFYEAGVMEETKRLVARLEAGKYDDNNKDKVKTS